MRKGRLGAGGTVIRGGMVLYIFGGRVRWKILIREIAGDGGLAHAHGWVDAEEL